MTTAVATKTLAGFPAHMIKSSPGKKILMAVTGLIAFGYVVGHMLGNLQIFLSQNQINAYAAGLHSLGPLLWVIRLFLVGSFGIHIWFGIQLKLENWAARPITYRNESTVQATFASRTMIWTGLILLAFVVYHILHYTARTTNPEFLQLTDAMGRFDVHSMVIMGFSNYLVSAFYLIAVALVSYHLTHGIASMFQSLGLNNPRWQVRLNRIAWVVTIVLFLGYAAVPAAVMLKLLTPAGGGM